MENNDCNHDPLIFVDCSDIVEFIQLLNSSVKGKKVSDVDGILNVLNGSYNLEDLSTVLRLCLLLDRLESMFKDHDPKNYKNCRFGNKAFCTWLDQVREMCDGLFTEFKLNADDEKVNKSAKKHFLNSFGNSARIDYGTGHELEFVYFIMDLYHSKLINEDELDTVVLVLLNKYFEFTRKLLDRYTLEPAGSKGAWGVDDYQFLPFIFGSSQLLPTEIEPAECTKLSFVSEHSKDYLLMRAMEYKISILKGMSIELASPLICNILESCQWEKINYGLFQLYINDVQRLNARKIVNRD